MRGVAEAMHARHSRGEVVAVREGAAPRRAPDRFPTIQAHPTRLQRSHKPTHLQPLHKAFTPVMLAQSMDSCSACQAYSLSSSPGTKRELLRPLAQIVVSRAYATRAYAVFVASRLFRLPTLTGPLVAHRPKCIASRGAPTNAHRPPCGAPTDANKPPRGAPTDAHRPPRGAPIDANSLSGVVASRRSSLRCRGDACSSSATVSGCQAVTSTSRVFTCSGRRVPGTRSATRSAGARHTVSGCQAYGQRVPGGDIHTQGVHLQVPCRAHVWGMWGGRECTHARCAERSAQRACSPAGSAVHTRACARAGGVVPARTRLCLCEGNGRVLAHTPIMSTCLQAGVHPRTLARVRAGRGGHTLRGHRALGKNCKMRVWLSSKVLDPCATLRPVCDSCATRVQRVCGPCATRVRHSPPSMHTGALAHETMKAVSIRGVCVHAHASFPTHAAAKRLPAHLSRMQIVRREAASGKGADLTPDVHVHARGRASMHLESSGFLCNSHTNALKEAHVHWGAARVHAHTNMHPQTHTHSHARTHMRTRTHTHTNAHPLKHTSKKWWYTRARQVSKEYSEGAMRSVPRSVCAPHMHGSQQIKVWMCFSPKLRLSTAHAHHSLSHGRHAELGARQRR